MARKQGKASRKGNTCKKSIDFSSSYFHKRRYFRLVREGPKIFQNILEVRYQNKLVRTPHILPISHGHNEGGDDFRRFLRYVDTTTIKFRIVIIDC